MRESGKIWHDKPAAGEYLVKWRIPADAVRGTVRFRDISAAQNRLTPELINCAEDRPSQATVELRRVGFPEGKSHSLDKIAGHTGTGCWPFSVEEYLAARHIARSFEDEEVQWLLATMCVSFRRWNLNSLEISSPKRGKRPCLIRLCLLLQKAWVYQEGLICQLIFLRT